MTTNIQNILSGLSAPVPAADIDENQDVAKAENDRIFQEFRVKEYVPETVYEYESTSKAARIAYDIFSVLFFPLGIYRLIHIVAGKFIVIAQLFENRLVKKYFSMSNAKRERKSLEYWLKIRPDLAAKRISVIVNGKKIDAMILGKRENLNNRRWMLYSNGNGAFYEGMVASNAHGIIDKIDELGTNILFYNYQGVGASEGHSTRDGIVNTHKAMLQFLKDEVQAKEIIQWGTSLGGGVQGHAMKTHQPKEGVRYVCLKDQTFSKISKVPKPFLGFLIKIFGWELSSMSSSSKLEHPEIIIQDAKKIDPEGPEDIEHDGVIPDDGSLAKELLLKAKQWTHKKFIGSVNCGHMGWFSEKVQQRINDAIILGLSPSYSGFTPQVA